jgi:cation diffusion facilitator family transporter
LETAQIKKRAALLSISSNITLIISKFIVGMITGSVSIISEAVHSFSDLLAAVLAYFSVKAASEPADIEHQFGHGKFEDLSGGIEGALILFAAGYIIYEAIEKILGKVPSEFDTGAGIIVMFIAIVINIAVSRHLFKVAHKTESIALLADAEHLRTDVYTSAGVLVGLVLIRFTGITLLDPIVAILIALVIIRTGIDLCMTSAKNLLDTSLPEEERIVIKNIVNKYMPDEVIDILKLKTRRAGAERLIEFTLTVPDEMTIKSGHDLCDRIEDDIAKEVNNVKVTIHLEPCDGKCPDCNSYHSNTFVCHKLKDK